MVSIKNYAPEGRRNMRVLYTGHEIQVNVAMFGINPDSRAARTYIDALQIGEL